MMKFIRRTVWFLLLLGLLLFVAYQSILRTQLGSRWLLDFVSAQWVQELTYENVSGTVSQGLTLENVSYQDKTVAVHVNKLETGVLKLNYMKPAASLSKITIVDTVLELKNKGTAEVEGTVVEAWGGFSLPLDVNVDAFNVLNFSMVQSDAEPIYLKSLSTAVEAEKDTWAINDLIAEILDLTVKAEGEFKTNEQLSVQLKSQLLWQAETENWQATLKVKGDKNLLSGELSQTYVDDMIDGETSSQFEIKDVLDKLLFDIKTSSNQIIYTDIYGDVWQAKLPSLKLSGNINAYQLSGEVEIESEQFNQVSANWQATGDLNGLLIQNLNLDGDAGALSLEGSLNWQEGFSIDAQLKTEAINPAFLYTEWPGQLDIAATVKARWVDENQWHVNLPVLDIKGALKDIALSVTAEGKASASNPSQVSAKGFWGGNRFDVKGQEVTADVNAKWLLDAELALSQLDLIDPNLQGEVSGTVQVKDNQGQFQIEANLAAQELKYQNNVVSKASISFNGSLESEMSLEVILNDAIISNQKINQLTVKGSGLLGQHEFDIKVDTNDVSSEASVSGVFNQDKNDISYVGSLNKHKLSLKAYEGQWQLINKTEFNWLGSSWKVSRACWQQQLNATTDKLCFDASSSKSNHITGQLELAQFDLNNWAFLMPQGLSLAGYLEGGFTFEWLLDEIEIDAQLALMDGVWQIEKADKSIHKLAFSEAKLTAEQVNEEAKVLLNLAMEDGSFLTLDTEINQDQGAGVQLNGEFKGHLADNDLISGLSHEIKKLEGQLNLSGKVSGLLNQPQISAQFSLDGGDLSLSSVDVPIKEIRAELNSTSQSDFHYLVTAKAGSGNLTAEGDILIPSAGDWEVTSEISGKEFLVADGSQLVLSLSPQINVNYTSKATNITGELVIPKANVTIKELPASVTTISSDVTYVGDDQVVSSTSSSSVVLDVKAIIKDKVKLEVLGLKADLSGSLQLKNDEQKQELKAFGQLKLTDGVYEIYGQALQITQGVLIFDGPLDNPILQVRAERKAQNDQLVGIKLSGDVNNYKTTLFANPPLSDAETLSYIVTGKGLSGLQGSGDSDKIAEAVLLMGLRQNNELINGLKNGLGIDVLNVSNQSETGATVEAGKNLGDKVFVGYNQGIFKHIGYWLLRYKINDKLSLETKQGDEQSVDLVYRREKE